LDSVEFIYWDWYHLRMSVCLSVHLSLCPYVQVPVSLSVFMCIICLSILPYAFLLSLSLCLSIYSPIYLYLSINLYIHLCLLYQTIFLSYISVYPFSLFILLFVHSSLIFPSLCHCLCIIASVLFSLFCLCFYPIRMSVYPSICPTVHPTLHTLCLSFFLSFFLSISSYVHPSLSLSFH
jgi:hypothetical protein